MLRLNHLVSAHVRRGDSQIKRQEAPLESCQMQKALRINVIGFRWQVWKPRGGRRPAFASESLFMHGSRGFDLFVLQIALIPFGASIHKTPTMATKQGHFQTARETSQWISGGENGHQEAAGSCALRGRPAGLHLHQFCVPGQCPLWGQGTHAYHRHVRRRQTEVDPGQPPPPFNLLVENEELWYSKPGLPLSE